MACSGVISFTESQTYDHAVPSVHRYDKMTKAEQWDCALQGVKGGEKVDLHTKEEIKKKLMLERFQEEVGF